MTSLNRMYCMGYKMQTVASTGMTSLQTFSYLLVIIAFCPSTNDDFLHCTLQYQFRVLL